MELNIASFNVSSASDLRKALDRRVIDQGGKTVDEIYNDLALQMFSKIAATFDTNGPDIICLQEFSTKAPEHKPIQEFLKRAGYELIGLETKDTVIAYKNDRFTKHSSEILDSDNAPTITADLKDSITGKVIRVISDHVPGFNSQEYIKEADKKTSKDEMPESIRMQTDNGDNHIKRILEKTNLTAKGFFKRLFSESNQEPALIIYAGDTNSSNARVHKSISPIHPDRIGLLEKLGFATDQTDIEPTLIEHNTRLPYKYDHIFAKAITGSMSIEHQEIEGLTGEAMLAKYVRENMSDHVPIFAKIKLV